MWQGLPTLPVGRPKVSTPGFRPETCGRADGGVVRPAPNIAAVLLCCVALWRTQRSSLRGRTSAAPKVAVLNVDPLLPTHGRRWKGETAQLAQGFGAEPGVISGGAADRASESFRDSRKW